MITHPMHWAIFKPILDPVNCVFRSKVFLQQCAFLKTAVWHITAVLRNMDVENRCAHLENAQRPILAVVLGVVQGGKATTPNSSFSENAK